MKDQIPAVWITPRCITAHHQVNLFTLGFGSCVNVVSGLLQCNGLQSSWIGVVEAVENTQILVGHSQRLELGQIEA